MTRASWIWLAQVLGACLMFAVCVFVVIAGLHALAGAF